MNKKLYGYGALALSIFIIDRITKLCALTWLSDATHVINSFLSFELVFNRGISWGMFHSSSDIIFTTISVMIVLFTAAFCVYAYQRYTQGYVVTAEVCIIIGSCCNLIDRVMYHGVIDFIVVSYKNVSWPVFNIADTAIVIGIGILIFQSRSS